MKILLVEDDAVQLRMLERTLSKAGHETLSARDGAEGLELLAAEPVRMVVTDRLMPRMDGLELCRRIRASQNHRYIYVILLTCQTGSKHAVEGLQAGADDYIAKPFDVPELLLRVKAGERVISLETRHVAIFALAKLAESRDAETGYHLERMRNYARILAEAIMGLPEYAPVLPPDFAQLIYLTSPLHDIGKVGIPDYVLLKRGHLSDDEYALMKRHTLIGHRTLRAAMRECEGAAYLRMAAEIAHGHHERFDGGGYPRGIEGNAIPMPARIAALADVYDALVAKRVYKAAIPHHLARGVILEERGKHFDPVVVDAFLAHEDAFVACTEAYGTDDADAPAALLPAAAETA